MLQRSKKHLNQADFTQIKALLDSKFSVSETARIMARSYGLVKRINELKTYKEYAHKHHAGALRIAREGRIYTNKIETELLVQVRTAVGEVLAKYL